MSFAEDFSIVDPTAVDQTGPQYAIGQWFHGDPKLAPVGGVPYTGGLVIDRKYVSDRIKPPAGWADRPITFSSGKTVPSLTCQQPKLAVIRSRFRWFVTFNGVTTYYPRNAYVADSGMRGHLQVLCGVDGFDFPLVVTFKGTSSKDFDAIRRDFGQKVKDAAKQAWPSCAFYITLQPGPHDKRGQKGQDSIVTPPTLAAPAAFTQDYLGKIYVGRENLVAWQQEYHRADEWAAAWSRPGAEEAQPEQDGQGGPLDGMAGEYADDDPAMQPVGRPHQTAAQALGVEATFGAGQPKRRTNYSEGR